MRDRMRTLGLRGLLAITAIGGALGLCAVPALAQQKTERQCRAEWQANKADNQAKGILERDFVARCRAGATTAQPTAAPAAPATAPQPAPAASRTAPPAPTRRETAAAAPAGGFANEALAKARCPTDTVVWVNEKSRVYHFAGHKDYGNTKVGTYMCEQAALAAGDRAAKNEKHP